MATDIVHQGILHKLGGNVKSWTKRWMILRKDNALYYYKDPAKSPQGSIPLNDHMFFAKEGRERDLNWPKSVSIERTIVIRTSYRIYYMYADTQQEAAEWIEKLQGTAENILGKKIQKRPDTKAAFPSEVPASHHSTSSVSSSFTTSVDTVESIYDAANHPDSDSSISTDEENGQRRVNNTDYDVPASGKLAEDDDVYEFTDSHSQPSRTSSKSLTSSLPLPSAPVVNANGNKNCNQPIYEDPETVATNPPSEVYEVVNDNQPPWAVSRHLPPSDPPPPLPSDEDEDTVPLPQPALPPKNSEVPPPLPTRGSSSKFTNGSSDSPPPLPSKNKPSASSPNIAHANNEDSDYSLLNKIESKCNCTCAVYCSYCSNLSICYSQTTRIDIMVLLINVLEPVVTLCVHT